MWEEGVQVWEARVYLVQQLSVGKYFHLTPSQGPPGGTETPHSKEEGSPCQCTWRKVRSVCVCVCVCGGGGVWTLLPKGFLEVPTLG